MTNLDANTLKKLLRSVFPPLPDDRAVGILVDIPRNSATDNDAWRNRRLMAQAWTLDLRENISSLSWKNIALIGYPDVGSNNADLPSGATLVPRDLPDTASALNTTALETPFTRIFQDFQIFLAPTEFSATAPLKIAARRYGFRAATMPGFSSAMIPALKIDYHEVNRRVERLKEALDRAEEAEVLFRVDGEKDCRMIFDLRFRTAHASSGRFPDKGTAGNLPSGEAYIVPYEGEKEEASRTRGILPVQENDAIALFTVSKNRAVTASGNGDFALRENDHLRREPAYGNMAELGFGVLGDFGLKPIGRILLDEKLGFHIAFGRSEHFGGRIGPADFSSPEAVIHLDRIYIPATQSRISLKSITLKFPAAPESTILKNGNYTIFQ